MRPGDSAGASAGSALAARGRAGADVGSPAGPRGLVPPTRHSTAAVERSAPAQACGGGATSYGSLLLVLALVVRGSSGVSATLGRPGHWAGAGAAACRCAVRLGQARLRRVRVVVQQDNRQLHITPALR